MAFDGSGRRRSMRSLSRSACVPTVLNLARLLLVLALVEIQILAPVVAQTLPSDLSQKPLLSSQAGVPNVVLMVDDSNSMSYNWLNSPPDFDWAMVYSQFATGWINYATNSGTTVRRRFGDVSWDTPYMNPVYYNPAITYRPWNDNNKAAASNFPPSTIGSYDASGAFLNGARVDPRFVQDGATRYPVSLKAWELFSRPTGKRTVDTCSSPANGPHTEWVCTYAPNPLPEHGDIATCGNQTVNGPYCADGSDLVPELVPARYTSLEGSWATDRYNMAKYRLIEIDRAFPSRMYTVPVDPRTGVQPLREDCALKTSCTFTEEAQNFANWFTYHRTRLFATIATTADVLSNLKSPIRLGYGRINHFAGAPEQWPGVASTAPGATLPGLDGVASPGHIVRGVRNFDSGTAARQEVFDWLFTLNAVTGTPNREALDAVGRYYMRSDARGPWSDAPGVGPGGGTADKSCRRSYTILATDGLWTDYASGQPRITTAYGATPGSPIESDAVTGPLIQGGGAQAGRDYQYTASSEPVFGDYGSQNGTLTDVAHYYWSRDLRPDLLNNNVPSNWSGGAGVYPTDFFDPSTWQNMRTMIIGYGLSSWVTNDSVLEAMRTGGTVSWPTVNASNDSDNNKVLDTQRAAYAGRGAFFAAADTAALTKALSDAFSTVASARASSSGLGVSSAVVRDSNDLVFEAGYQTTEWTGSLTALEALSLVNGTRQVRWEASLPAHSARSIFTASTRTTGVPFAWANLSAAQQTALGGAAMVDYLRGDTSNEVPTGTYRKRAGPLGTIVHSSPLYSKATNQGYQTAPSAGGPNYTTYLKSKIDTRPATIFVNSNDGMMHAFRVSDGAELFSYVPRAAIAAMPGLADTNYDHFYLVDGQVSEGDIYDGAWRTVVVGSGGAGPASLFALDVTDPTAFSAGKVRFDLTQADVPELGHIMGRVLIASTTSGKWVAITGNGYESTTDRAVLLVIDLSNGTVLRKIDTGVGSSSAGQRNGLGPVTPIYNAKRNVVGLYAGDKLGNLWKFDLSSASAGDWAVATPGGGPMFTAKNGAGQVQAITTEARVTEHPAGGLYVAFGTGKYFENGDPLDTRLESLYFLRDTGNGASIARSSLLPASMSAGTTGFREFNGLGSLDWASHKGWMIDLAVGGAGNGERIISAPVMANGKVTFTSFRPAAADPCASGGDSYLYTIDLATGMQRSAYEGMATNVIGRKLVDGFPGGMLPLYVPPSAAPTTTSSISASMLGALVNAPRYRPGGVVNGGGRCSGFGTSIKGMAATVPTACAGVMPLRTWRDMR